MKRFVSFSIVIALLFTVVSADISYVKLENRYEWSKDTVSAAVRADNKNIIPFSITDYYDYGYAYTKDGCEIEMQEFAPVSFSDVDEYDLFVNELSAKGVLTGNGDGTFEPDRILTRAEMAAVFARLFSVDTSDDAPAFSDVAADSWYAPYVMGLYKIGVFSLDDKFNPDDNISREQLTAMAYRMFKEAGAKDNGIKSEYQNVYTDVQSVSDYAKPAYDYFNANGYMNMMDVVENDPLDYSDDLYSFAPQKGVTRYECASFLYYLTRDFFMNNAPALKRDNAPDAEIPVLDGSTSTYPITLNIYDDYYINAKNKDGFPTKHSKTDSAYRRLIDGEVEMIFVPDPSESIVSYAKEKSVKLKYVPIASEALVFFNDKNNKVGNVTKEQLNNIYVNNGIKNWSELGGDNLKLAAYCRNNDSGSHAQMEKFILDGKTINDEITKERTSYVMSSILTDVESFNENNKEASAMGYSLYYYFNSVQTVLGTDGLKLMSVNGVAPTEETIADGTYPFSTFYYAVVRDEENEKVDKFIELLKGDFGKSIIERSGYGVVK